MVQRLQRVFSSTRNALFLVIGLFWLLFIACYLEVLEPVQLFRFDSLQRTSNMLFNLRFGRKPKHEIYATLLTGQETASGDKVDHYFNATRILVHRLIRGETRDHRPVVVFVTPDVEKWKKQRLRMDGAIVRPIRKLSLLQAIGGLTPDWMQLSESSVLQNGGAREPRWKDQFTKLQLLGMTEYDKIVYLDSDVLVLEYIGDLFALTPPISRKSVTFAPEYRTRSFDVLIDQEPSRPNDAPHPRKAERYIEDMATSRIPKSELYPYVFYAVSDPGHSRADEHGPPKTTNLLNAGVIVVTPSHAHYSRIMQLAKTPKWWNYGRLMEQDLLRLAFHKKGEFPFGTIEWKYNLLWAKKEDLELGTKTIHGKLWETGVEKELSDLYFQALTEVMDYWRPGPGGNTTM